jgi:hypothetical protein
MELQPLKKVALAVRSLGCPRIPEDHSYFRLAQGCFLKEKTRASSRKKKCLSKFFASDPDIFRLSNRDLAVVIE